MTYCQDQGESYLIHHQMVSLKKSLTEKFGVKSLQVVVSLFEIDCIITFQGETSWLKNKLRLDRGLWLGSRGGLSDSLLNRISLKKSQREVFEKSLQVVVSLFETACILPFTGETS